MSDKELVVLLWAMEAGRVRCDRDGRLTFVYADAWSANDDAVPLSLSMPIGKVEHPHKLIDAYLWGLLPDNASVLENWGKRFQVSPRNAFALLSNVGEDCAGAVQFVPPERLDSVLGAGPEEVVWLDESEIAARLRNLRMDQGAWRSASDTGQFSLAGSQAKTAFLHHGGRFGVPSGRTPTTHILKPPSLDFTGHVENEHLCLRLARSLGLTTAHSEIRRFGDETAIVVTRFDRVPSPDASTSDDWPRAVGAAGNPAPAPSIRRLHQEDMCQALGLPPRLKYQSDGGPSPSAIVRLLREHSNDRVADVLAFVDALAFNWLIGGTDAHAKNYSVILGGRRQVRLAPLYDVASALAYLELDARRLKSAMRIGSRYRLDDIGRHEWLALADELALDGGDTLMRIVSLATALPGAVEEIASEMRDAGLSNPIVPRLREVLTTRAQTCLDVLTRSTA